MKLLKSLIKEAISNSDFYRMLDTPVMHRSRESEASKSAVDASVALKNALALSAVAKSNNAPSSHYKAFNACIRAHDDLCYAANCYDQVRGDEIPLDATTAEEFRMKADEIKSVADDHRLRAGDESRQTIKRATHKRRR